LSSFENSVKKFSWFGCLWDIIEFFV
jgi:hypothetical protein